MIDQDTIDQAVQVIAGAVKFPDCIHYDRSQCLLIDDPRSVARKLADAGLLAKPKCAHECEALRDWDALVAERDAALAKLDRVRVAADKLAECEAFDHDSHDTYHEGRRDAYDVAEQVVRDALEDQEASE